MTDGEPEPFRMSTDPDEEPPPSDADASPGDAEDDASAAVLPGGVESIADLIDEASRTAAEQAVQEATGTAPVDRSSDVWGSIEDDEDLDAVWSAAQDRHRGSHVFDDVLGPEEGWQNPTRMPPPAADPTIGLDDDEDDDEPEVFKLSVDDEDDVTPAVHDTGTAADAGTPAADASIADEDGTVADETVEDETIPDEPVDDAHDEDDPEPFRFAAGPATTAPAEVPDHVPTAGRDEPDLFAFAFDEATPDDDGPTPDEPDADARDEDTDDEALAAFMPDDDAADDGAAHAAAPQEDPVSEEPDVADDGDGDVWATASLPDDDADALWAAAGGDDEPGWGTEEAEEPAWGADTDDEPWSAPSAPDETASTDEGDDDAAWTFDVGGSSWDEDDAAEGPDDEAADGPTLAETATPRADTGWHDLADEPATWSLDPVPTGESDVFDVPDDAAGDDADTDDDAPDGFTTVVGDDDGFLPDDEPLAPTREPDPPFQTENAALGDVIDDLLGDLGPVSGLPGDTGGDDALDGFGDLDDTGALDDALAGLDQFDDIGDTAPAAAEDAPTDDPATVEPASTPTDLAGMPPPTGAPAPSPADLLADAPPPDAPVAHETGEPAPDAPLADVETDDAAHDDEAPEPEPTPAPAGMNFASKPKKRGLFGR